jgi:hypothetical protein
MGWFLLGQAGGGAGDLVNLTQFGVAGLMGALWWWERRYSRQREEELTEAHRALMDKQEHLAAVLDALQGNTKVIVEFTSVQNEILQVMRGERSGATPPGGQWSEKMAGAGAAEGTVPAPQLATDR